MGTQRLLGLAVAALTAATLVQAGPGAQASARTGHRLVLTGISGPRLAHATGMVAVSVKVRARVKSRATKVHWYLSRDRHHSHGDLRLTPASRVPRLRADHSTRVQGLVTVPGRATGKYHLLACAKHAACVSQRTKVRVGTTSVTSSDGLITAALAAHKIGNARAVTYRALAAVGDPHLPARYRGDPGADEAADALRAADAAWSTLSGKQRRWIRPYLQGPSYGRVRTAGRAVVPTSTKSVCKPQHLADAGHVDALGGRIRIWYSKSDDYYARADAKAAPQLARDAAHIWKKYAALMGRTPPSDAHEKCGNGGDGRYDIYLDYNVGGSGWTGIYKGHGGTGGPSFIAFSTWGAPPNRWALAHELFHAFQFAYHYAAKPDLYTNFDEGAAHWGANYVYPRDDLEHGDSFLLKWPRYYSMSYTNYPYPNWAFDLYLTTLYGDRQMPAVYAAFKRQKPWDALDAVVPGGLDARWKEFIRYAWNQEPVTGGFRAWDRFDQVPDVTDGVPVKAMDLRIGGLEQCTLNLPFDLWPLAHEYRPLHLADGKIRELIFDNTVAGRRHASVQAFLKMADGKWHTEDWSKRPTVDLCRDQPDQDVTDLVVMYGIADPAISVQTVTDRDRRTIKPSREPTLTLRSTCDKFLKVTGVGGSYDMTYNRTTSGPNCTYASHDHYVTTPSTEPDTGYDGSFGDTGGTMSVPLHKHGTASGSVTCPGAPLDNQSCDRVLDDEGSYYLDIEHVPGAATAKLKFHALSQPYNDCSSTAKDGGETTGVTHPTIDTDVAWSALTGTAPFTVHVNGTFDDPDHKVTRDYTVTLQRVDENGVPLA
ncbi:hypothetical protein [Nocardioides terrisoli]|uniref:hypothetical protein n=1 Tax=Nocardioides terrisoli TaxID=3388267 RepID=UPI00287B86F9|nr:hypothetical protein [Nocardioides marmorisolisilvae]